MKKTNKIFIVSLLFIFCFAPIAQAQLGLPENSVPTADKKVRESLAPVKSDGSDASGGILGKISDAVDVVGSLKDVLSAASCITSEVAGILNTANNVNGWTFGGLKFLTGDAGESVMLKGQIIALSGVDGKGGAKGCVEGQIKLIKKSGIKSVQEGQLRQSKLDELTKELQVINLKLDSLNAQYRNAQRGFWKALVVKSLITTSKAIATSLANKLVNSYKIQNYKQYVDTAATLMYDNQFLRDNFPDTQSQMMARAILNNPSVAYHVQPGIFIAADAALGFNPKGLNPNDPNYYTKMAQVGGTAANPYFQNAVMVGGVDQSRANSLAYAQGHIQQGNGYKAPVTCAGSLAQQQAIDGQTKAASDRLGNRRNLLNDLQQAQSLGQPVKTSDMQRAQADYDAALANWDQLPATVTGSNTTGRLTTGGGAEGKAAITICEAIVSPASLVNKGIDAAFNAVTKNMSDFNDNNLPMFINLVSSVAGQIGSSLIYGGAQGAKGALIMNEGRLVTGAVAAANEHVQNNIQENLAKGIDFNISKIDSGNNYNLNWQILLDQIPNANFVTIEGNGIPMDTDPVTHQQVVHRYQIDDSVTIHPTAGGDYILYIFDKNGKALAVTAKGNIDFAQYGTGETLGNPPIDSSGTDAEDVEDPNANQDVTFNSNSRPSVAGASTSRPQINIRGAVVNLSLRGN